jgi:hypothetical protein
MSTPKQNPTPTPALAGVVTAALEHAGNEKEAMEALDTEKIRKLDDLKYLTESDFKSVLGKTKLAQVLVEKLCLAFEKYFKPAPPPVPQGGSSTAPPPGSPGSGAGASTEIIHFVQELHKSNMENGVLELKNGASFFGWEPWGSKLYMRKAYKGITDRIIKEGIHNLSISFLSLLLLSYIK